MSKRRNKLFKSLSKCILLIFLVIILSIIAKVFLPNFNKVDYREHLGLINEEVAVIFNNEYIPLENIPIMEDGQLFLPFSLVKEYIDPYIFWDEAENKLTITNEKNVIRMQTEELEYFVNNEPLNLNLPIYEIDNVVYIPYDFLKSFYKDFSFNFYSIENELKNILVISELPFSEEYISLKSNTIIRTEPDKKSPIIAKYADLIFNQSAVLINNFEENGYVKIKTTDGYIGYIKKSSVEKTLEIVEYSPEKIEEKEGKTWEIEGKINLVFEQMTTVTAVRNSIKKEYPEEIDVLVPTFFSFANTSGEILNLADKTYVDNAHNNGFQVWGLLTDNFDSTISHSVLSSTETREYVIKQILSYVSLYELDGINIDFESVPSGDGEYFIQFLRELAPLLKNQGAVLSVDLFVPKAWTAHYMREEVGKIVDYAIVMGYDEHYAGSENAGSVASISWSKEAITSTLAENVPKDKLILGVPFYTRIWTEENIDGEINLSSSAYGMESAYEFIIEKGGEFIWLEDMGQYYAEVKEDNVTYKVWLEDENSLAKRLDLILQYDIAGCGAWKLWLENDEVWEVLNEKLKG